MNSLVEDTRPLAPVLTLDERRFTRLGRWLVLLGFGGFVLWAALAPLDKGVSVSGNVVVAGSRQVVQHQLGGLIERILVRDGDTVSAGQVLVQMDATQTRSQRESLYAQYINARASEARLSAERDGQASIQLASDLLAAETDPWVASALQLQRQLLTSRRDALRMEVDGLKENIAGAQAMLQGVRDSMTHKEEQRAAMAEQLKGQRELAREGYLSRNRLLETERLYAQLNGTIAEDLGNLGRTQRQVLELKLRIGQRQGEYQRDLRQQLSDTQLKAQDLASRLRAADFELANTQVRAPAAGTVVGLSVFTPGGVISPGQQLMEIVPNDVPLLVDARAPVELVDKLHPGLEVELLFVAFSQSKTPRVAGTLTLVSADRLEDEKTGEPYYKVRAQVSDAGMQQLAGEAIRPGMPVQAFVRTGERSLLSYLFKPLLDRTHMAMAEE